MNTLRLINTYPSKIGKIALFVAIIIFTTDFKTLAFENTQENAANLYLGEAVSGPGYKVEQVVQTDGFLRVFTFETYYGRYQIHGAALAKKRIHELRALDLLIKARDSEVFLKSLGRAAVSPLRYGGNLIQNPEATLNRTASGVANMFDRMSASLDNRTSKRDSAVESLIGIAKARREIAVELGIDPYTDYPPLHNKLDEVARASALGNISVSAALSVIPGAGAIIFSSAGTANSIKDTLLQLTSAQIVSQVKTMLLKLKVSSATVDLFVSNRNYTPADLFLMASALTKLNAAGTEIFLDRAAQAATHDVAYFQRQRAELLSNLRGISDFISIDGFPLNRKYDGTIMAVVPVDDIIWTETTSKLFNRVTTSMRQRGIHNSAVLASNATVTPLAEKELEKLGWKILYLSNREH